MGTVATPSVAGDRTQEEANTAAFNEFIRLLLINMAVFFALLCAAVFSENVWLFLLMFIWLMMFVVQGGTAAAALDWQKGKTRAADGTPHGAWTLVLPTVLCSLFILSGAYYAAPYLQGHASLSALPSPATPEQPATSRDLVLAGFGTVIVIAITYLAATALKMGLRPGFTIGIAKFFSIGFASDGAPKNSKKGEAEM